VAKIRTELPSGIDFDESISTKARDLHPGGDVDGVLKGLSAAYGADLAGKKSLESAQADAALAAWLQENAGRTIEIGSIRVIADARVMGSRLFDPDATRADVERTFAGTVEPMIWAALAQAAGRPEGEVQSLVFDFPHLKIAVDGVKIS
jgi:hypothetical protein